MDKIEFRKNKDNIVDIIYEGKVYGKWDVDTNIRYPEDLTLDGDLMNIGVEIKKKI